MGVTEISGTWILENSLEWLGVLIYYQFLSDSSHFFVVPIPMMRAGQLLGYGSSTLSRLQYWNSSCVWWSRKMTDLAGLRYSPVCQANYNIQFPWHKQTSRSWFRKNKTFSNNSYPERYSRAFYKRKKMYNKDASLCHIYVNIYMCVCNYIYSGFNC